MDTIEIRFSTGSRLSRTRRLGPNRCDSGFTLIELLVVVAIIAILASLLLPTLARAKAKSLQSQCLGNQHQIGLAYKMYADDNLDDYPRQAGWGAGGGTVGTRRPDFVSASFGVTVPEEDRPLNAYTENPELFRCPADKGDELYGEDHCYLGYGNSYLPQFSHDSFRVRHVVGDSRVDPNSYAGTPMKASEVSVSPHNKVFQGDWHWHPNRGQIAARSIWHNYKGQPRYNMLFGDGHVEFYRFPEDLKNHTFGITPDPAHIWW